MTPTARSWGARPLLATVLLLVWMVVMGTSVSFPLFVPLRELMEPSVPPLGRFTLPYIASFVVCGSKITTFVAQALGAMLGWDPATPPAVEPWLLAARRVGELTGIVMAAVIPAWLFALWSRRAAPQVHRRGWPIGPGVPVAVALLWTLIVAQPLVGLVGRVVFPVDTWLMLPPVAKADTPESHWCAYQLHPSTFSCEADRMNLPAGRVDSIQGYAFVGSRCVSAADVPRPGCEPPRVAAGT